MNVRPRVSVLGGGVVGAAIAYSLSGRQIDVDLFDADRPAGGTTRSSFAWINAQSTLNRGYFDLRMQAVCAYRELPEALRRSMDLRWTGSLTFNQSPEALQLTLARLQAWGHSIRAVEAREFRAFEPGFRNPPPLALYSDMDGIVEARRATFALLSAARARGARLHFNARVDGLTERHGRVASLRVAGSDIACDAVVLAVGADTNALLAPVGSHLPITCEMDTLVYLRPMPRLFDRVLNTPTYHVRQRLDGHIVLGSDVATERADSRQDLAANVLHRFAADVDPAVGALVLTARRSRRVIPTDGMPIVGHVPGIPNLYVAVMHSGITLAPLIGEIAAAEVLDGASTRLDPQFRPQRFPPSRPLG